MSAEARDFEALLRQALTPVEPPGDLADRLELTFANLAELAADELESWELAAMKDPRNWARPAAAVVVGTTAGAALVVLRARQRQKRNAARGHGIFDVAERTVRDAIGEARRMLDNA